MGTFQNHVVIGFASHKFMEDDVEELKTQLPECIQGIILGPYKGFNSYVTYFWAPDGSKEGREPSNIADEYREKFSNIFKDKVELQWGELGQSLKIEGY